MDLVNGTIYAPGENGTTQAQVTLADFISVCNASDCAAIIELPLEIDRPYTAAYEVGYIENTLLFHPAYWELGNEPASWTCYGVPWHDWGTDCPGGVNATSYATEVGKYIPAVRAVDPSAQFIGLGGTNEASWITPLEQADGHNLAAISLHSYVDDLDPNPTNLSLANFFWGLTGPTAVPRLLEAARNALEGACSTCPTRVFITEMDSVSVGQPLSAFLDTYYNGLFFAAEITQGLNSQTSNIDPFAWEGGQNGIINSSGVAPRYVVESSFFNRLGPLEYNASVNRTDVFAAVTGGNGTNELLVVNTNTTTPVAVSLNSSGLAFSGSVKVWTWSPSDSSPSESNISATAIGSVTVPALSVMLVAGVGAVTEISLFPPPSISPGSH
ncbi:MAG: hypothetical protein WB809_00580 [Thermoplasmata archaeon]